MFDSILNDTIRPVQARDIIALEMWRKQFAQADLTRPFGYDAPGVETAVHVNGKGQLTGALTAVLVTSLDTYIRNPQASETESLLGLHALCRHLESNATKAGARESFIAVPNTLAKYQGIVQKVGFVVTAQDCKIFRRVLGG